MPMAGGELRAAEENWEELAPAREANCAIWSAHGAAGSSGGKAVGKGRGTLGAIPEKEAERTRSAQLAEASLRYSTAEPQSPETGSPAAVQSWSRLGVVMLASLPEGATQFTVAETLF
jgi:hypothetical protein